MDKSSALPAAQREHSQQRPELQLVEQAPSPEKKQVNAIINRHDDDVEDMWDNMPV